MTTKTAIIFFDNSDEDVRLGLCFLWEALTNRGYHTWYNGHDVYNNGFVGIEPCDIYLINTTLSQEVMTVLKNAGFTITYIGNVYSPDVTYANSLCHDVTIISSSDALSGILFALYVYLEHSLIGNRLNFLPSKLVSDSLNFIYNNKLNELVSISLTTGVYIAGLNGLILKQNIGSAVQYSKALDERLYNLAKDKGNLYV